MSKHFRVLLAWSLIFVALFLTLPQDQGTASEVTGHLWRVHSRKGAPPGG